MKSLLLIFILLLMSLSAQSWQAKTLKPVHISAFKADTCTKIYFSSITREAVERVDAKVQKLENLKKKN